MLEKMKQSLRSTGGDEPNILLSSSYEPANYLHREPGLINTYTQQS